MIEVESESVARPTTLAEFIIQRRGNGRQDQLARKAGIRSSTLCKIEKGVIRRPTDQSIAGLAVALNVPAEHLFELRDHLARQRAVSRVRAKLETTMGGESPVAAPRARTLRILGAGRQDPPIEVLLAYGTRKR